MRRVFPAMLFLATTCILPMRDESPAEALWYVTNADRSVQSFLAHADRISIVAPQGFALDSLGNVRGWVHSRIVATARAKRIKLMPLIVNQGFDQASFHQVLVTPSARAQAVRNITRLCRENRFDGIQFDFENINVGDRDAFTSFSREMADSLHRSGCALSAAVVPRASDNPASTAYDQWMYDNWRGAYDYKALADTMDFLSLMTYSQHTRRTTPGPIAGYPWAEAAVKYLLSLGVPGSKISLGVPSYSQWWYTTYDVESGTRVTGRAVNHEQAIGMLTKQAVKVRWDDQQKEGFVSWQDNGLNQFLSLSDARSFAARLSLRHKYKLRGYSVWVLGFEDPNVWNETTPVVR